MGFLAFPPLFKTRKGGSPESGPMTGQLEPNRQLIARANFGKEFFGTEANVERGKEHHQEPG